ncbi:hypothetical protein HDU80_010117 [Chytriomyces hyalinus]|nr:hypothetical protein HDU80_010117 [Chytriomyces hyalinus]
MGLIVLGPLIQCVGGPRDRRLEIVPHACIHVGNDGVIESIEAGHHTHTDSEQQQQQHTVVTVQWPQFIVPGFVDLHLHAPQLPQAGTQMHVPLETWLRETTIPREARFGNVEWAQKVWQKLVRKTLSNGTSTAVYFASKHAQSALLLAEECLQRGQRAFVGKVCMDNKDMCLCQATAQKDSSVSLSEPCVCTESTQESVEETRHFIQEMASLNNTQTINNNDDPLVQPVITPRFVPSCSPELLTKLGQLTQEYKIHVQSHAWESDWQVLYGEETRNARDLDIFLSHNLVSPKGTVLAHAVHANDSEITRLAETGVGVAHCPLSNAFFANGIMPARLMLDAGVAVGLGTDIGGAWSASILDSCRQAITSSRILRDGVGKLRGGKPCEHAAEINHIDAFWMATVGGALALGRKGGIQVGAKFDALVIDVENESNIDYFHELDTPEDLFQKFVALGDDRNIRQVFVDGKCVLAK